MVARVHVVFELTMRTVAAGTESGQGMAKVITFLRILLPENLRRSTRKR